MSKELLDQLEKDALAIRGASCVPGTGPSCNGLDAIAERIRQVVSHVLELRFQQADAQYVEPFSTLRDEIKRLTKVKGDLEQERSALLNRLVGVDGLRDGLRAMTQERDRLQRCYTPGKVQELEQARDDLQHEVDGLHGICGEQRDELRQARTSYLHQRPTVTGTSPAMVALTIERDAARRMVGTEPHGSGGSYDDARKRTKENEHRKNHERPG